MKAVATALLVLATGAAHAGEVYVQGGFPGVMLGYAQNIDGRFTVRADLATAGRRTDTRNESGIDYDARLRTYRAGLFGDWYLSEGGRFRLTGGVTFNRYELSLEGRAKNGTLTIGDNTYVTSPDDRFDVSLKLSSPTPYIGIGWGHGAGTGWRFIADVGAMYGRAKISASLGGQLAAQVRQSDIDKELDQISEAVVPYRWIPQVTFGAAYSF